jgi:hypothetical protein
MAENLRCRAIAAMICAFALAIPIHVAAQAPQFVLPVDCQIGKTCVVQNYVAHDTGSVARDYQCGTLTYKGHNGTDFRLVTTAMQRAGVDVLAAAAGQVLRARDGMPDISFREAGAPPVENRECGNGLLIGHDGGWETQYCHMARGSLRVKGGDRVAAGQPIGRVGLSGRTEFPHLHLTVRHQGKVIDPFAFDAPKDSCGGGASLWSASIRNALGYRARLVLNAGFAAGAVTMQQIELGTAAATALTPDSPALVAFVRAIGLRAGDEQRLVVTAPNGEVIADNAAQPLDRAKAQYMLFTGNRRPPDGWSNGIYRAHYVVTHDGKIVLETNFAVTM